MKKMQDFTRADLGDFHSWPLDLLLKLGAELFLKDLKGLFGVNKAFQQIFTDNAFWENKFKIHYYRLYAKYQNQPVKSWYLLFKDAYIAEEKKIANEFYWQLNNRMKILLAVREGKLAALQKIENLKQAILSIPFHDIDGRDIFQIAYFNKDSAILTYFYSLIERDQNEADGRDGEQNSEFYVKKQINLLRIAIACQHGPDFIDNRLEILKEKLSWWNFQDVDIARIRISETEKVPSLETRILYGNNKVSLLEMAILYRNNKVIDYLLQRGAKAELVDLAAAVKVDDLDTFHMLLKCCEQTTLTNYNLSYLLGIAVSNNRLNFVKELITMGAEVDMIAERDRTPLYKAIEENVNPEIIQYLMTLKKIEVEKHNKRNKNKKDKTLLDACAASGNYQLFKEFQPMVGKNNEIPSTVVFKAFKAKQYNFLINILEEFKVNPYKIKRHTLYFYRVNLLDKLCSSRQLNNDEKKIANILVDNGAQPLMRAPLKEIITNPNTSITPEHLQIIYKKEIAQLKAYLAKRSGDTREYYFTFFGRKFGFSGSDKIIAAQALLNLLLGNTKDLSELNLVQWAALHQGTLGKIYRSVRVSCKIDVDFYAVLRPKKNDAPGR